MLTTSTCSMIHGSRPSHRCLKFCHGRTFAQKIAKMTICEATVNPDISLQSLRKGRQIGSGSFGDVFEGLVKSGGRERRVVLKQYKQVRGRDIESFYFDELNACRRLQNNEGVAKFLGVAGADVYLVWAYEGSVTLERVLASGAGVLALADVMETEEAAEALGRFAISLLAALMAMHADGVVHRDVKPGNVLFAQSDHGTTVKMIDLGGSADLMDENLRLDEAILDPVYGAPEQFLEKKGIFGGTTYEATGEVPTYQFDSYSAGLVILQIAVPTLHNSKAMYAMRKQLSKYDGDLESWRNSKEAQGNDFTFLSGLGDTAWDFIKQLTAQDPVLRLSVYDAFAHPYLKQFVKLQAGVKSQKKSSTSKKSRGILGMFST